MLGYTWLERVGLMDMRISLCLGFIFEGFVPPVVDFFSFLFDYFLVFLVYHIFLCCTSWVFSFFCSTFIFSTYMHADTYVQIFIVFPEKGIGITFSHQMRVRLYWFLKLLTIVFFYFRWFFSFVLLFVLLFGLMLLWFLYILRSTSEMLLAPGSFRWGNLPSYTLFVSKAVCTASVFVLILLCVT